VGEQRRVVIATRRAAASVLATRRLLLLLLPLLLPTLTHCIAVCLSGRRGAAPLASPRLASPEVRIATSACRAAAPGVVAAAKLEPVPRPTRHAVHAPACRPTPVAGCGGVNWTLWFRPTTAAGRTFRAVMKEDRDDVVGLYIEVEDGLLLAAL